MRRANSKRMERKSKLWLSQFLSRVSVGVLLFEFCVVCVVLFAFWHHTPPYREAWVWLIYLSIPFIAIRLWLYKYIVPQTPLNILLIFFILLAIANYTYAPYQRENLLVLLVRPLAGIWLFMNLITQAERYRRLDSLIVVTLGMATVLTALALTATQWMTKWRSDFFDLYDVASHLPTVDWSAIPPFQNALLSFNPNEIGGALAWIIPLMAGIALGAHKGEEHEGEPNSEDDHRRWLIYRIIAGILFVLATIALIFGQSRSAILGVLVSLLLLSLLLIRHQWIRRMIIASVMGGFLLIAMMLLNPFGIDPDSPDDVSPFTITVRDLNTALARRHIWSAAIDMMRDYPLTGIGMSMFRTATWYNQAYELDEFKDKGYPAPHAHNEWLQVGADLGIPGLLLYAAWHAAILWMLWRGYQHGNRQQQIIAVSVFAAFVSHNVYGLLDAITLWDRFQFMFWWMLGLGAAPYVMLDDAASKRTIATQNVPDDAQHYKE